jgi:hypothetical protein
MGRYIKGRSGNPQGRPVGSKNRATAVLMEKVNLLIEDNWDQVQEDLKQAEPKERLRFILALLNYALPKRQSVAIPLDLDEEDSDQDFRFVTISSREELERLNTAKEKLRTERELLEAARNKQII